VWTQEPNFVNGTFPDLYVSAIGAGTIEVSAWQEQDVPEALPLDTWTLVKPFTVNVPGYPKLYNITQAQAVQNHTFAYVTINDGRAAVSVVPNPKVPLVEGAREIFMFAAKATQNNMTVGVNANDTVVNQINIRSQLIAASRLKMGSSQDSSFQFLGYIPYYINVVVSDIPSDGLIFSLITGQPNRMGLVLTGSDIAPNWNLQLSNGKKTPLVKKSDYKCFTQSCDSATPPVCTCTEEGQEVSANAELKDGVYYLAIVSTDANVDINKDKIMDDVVPSEKNIYPIGFTLEVSLAPSIHSSALMFLLGLFLSVLWN